MTREELVALRTLLMRGTPPYTKNALGALERKSGGIPGIEERRAMGQYDTNASGVLLALEASLMMVDHILERTKK
jgi:hypothetical protein